MQGEEEPAGEPRPEQPVVVVGIDGSSESVHHAEGTDTAVHVVAVWHQPVQFAGENEFEAEARTWLTDALPRLAHDEPGAPVRAFTEQGDPRRGTGGARPPRRDLVLAPESQTTKVSAAGPGGCRVGLPRPVIGKSAAASASSSRPEEETVATQEFDQHTHAGTVHDHEHWHVTHNWSDTAGTFEHLASRHSHEHNHAAIKHAHVAHVAFDTEHAGEAHVHDHDQPTNSAPA
ncbi:universal stress protein [Pseudonocardia sp.]|uniref:universal stress protein n=1 Tax=Pseudonocardia sp. TaxID=60912 RepID=UPI0031FC8C8D